MKKLFLFLLVGALFTITSCEKEEPVPNEPAPPVVVVADTTVTKNFALGGSLPSPMFLDIRDESNVQVLGGNIQNITASTSYESATFTRDNIYTAELTYSSNIVFSNSLKFDSNGELVIITPNTIGTYQMDIYTGSYSYFTNGVVIY